MQTSSISAHPSSFITYLGIVIELQTCDTQCTIQAWLQIILEPLQELLSEHAMSYLKNQALDQILPIFIALKHHF